MHEIAINVYRDADGEWCSATWIDGAYDSSDALDIDASATTQDAMAAASAMPLRVDGIRTVRKVDDI